MQAPQASGRWQGWREQRAQAAQGRQGWASSCTSRAARPAAQQRCCTTAQDGCPAAASRICRAAQVRIRYTSHAILDLSILPLSARLSVPVPCLCLAHCLARLHRPWQPCSNPLQPLCDPGAQLLSVPSSVGPATACSYLDSLLYTACTHSCI